MDIFVHAPAKAASGGRLSVQVRVFGFPAVSTLAPLGGARVEAAWDPESLGARASAAPPPVGVTSDDGGHAHLDVEMPRGKRQDKLKLLLSARWRHHQRTREVEIERLAAHEVDLRVSDSEVVPGGSLSTWVFVRDLVSGQPLANAAVDVELKEGTVTRFSRRLSVDRAGMAATRVAVPFTDDPDWRWTLTARTAFGNDEEAEASRELKVREETPGAPALSVRWAQPSVPPGARASFQIRLRDGAGAAIARAPLRYWVGPRGTEPPKEEREWHRVSTVATTDGEGSVAVTVDTPATTSRRGAGLTVVAQAAVDGRPLSGRDTLALETPKPALEIVPESGVLLPGHAQRLFVHVTLGAEPVSAELSLEGHALAARLKTDARGWGEITWNVPRDVGATVPGDATTDCAGSVAATVRIRLLARLPGLPGLPGLGANAPPFDRCVRVDRDASAAVRPARPLVRAGEPLAVRVLDGGGGGVSPSVVLQAPDGSASAGGWIARGAAGGGGALRLPASARGVWTMSAAGWGPRGRDKGSATALAGSVLVLPRTLPLLVARRLDGDRRARGGTVELEAELSDGQGQPLTGTVGAVVVDKQGGARPEGLLALDTRRALVARLGVAPGDIEGFLQGDGRYDAQRWAALAETGADPLAPALDPAATVAAAIDEVFGDIVRSLEGGVFQSSGDPERLRDVRVRTAGAGFALNPEMLTLTTAAMDEPPTTPGGEPWRLADLMAIDAQVNYDNVARRVTRLKLFRLLSAVRTFIYEHRLGPDEPLLRDPNALLRRLVRDEVIAPAALLDPWARGITFVRAPGPRIPFLSLVPGYRLQSAGPDGRFGTADDVGDPFQRVLRSGTPYARAVEEDQIVDARWDMRVGEDTVDAWKRTLEEHTGTTLGDNDTEGDAYGVGGLGAAGYGSGGAGLGGRSSSMGIELGPAEWLPPVRTDDRGRVRLKVPLGSAETTWQILLVGTPDQGSPAVTSVEVPASAALSVAVNTGASWIVGDQVGVAIAVRNRTDTPLAATLRVAASGAAALVDPRQAARALALPARSTTPVVVYVRAAQVGTGILDASISASGAAAPAAAPDAVRHQWAIRPAGEVTTAADAIWVEREATPAFPGAADGATPTGPGRLVLERGLTPALAAALESLRPERLTGLRAIADALEIAARVRAWAVVRGGEADPLAVRARSLGALASGRKDAFTRKGHAGRGEGAADRDRPLLARAELWEVAANPSPGARSPGRRDDAGRADCPPKTVSDLVSKLDWLEATPRGDQGADRACWVAFGTSALQQLAATSDPLLLARAVLAVMDRPANAIVAGALVDRLRAAAPVRDDGTLVLPAAQAGDRAARTIVMAALVRARRLGNADRAAAAIAGRLSTRLLVERDAEGGYGSVQATRAAVRVLLESEGGGGGGSGGAAPASATVAVRWTEVRSDGRTGASGRVELARAGTASVPLGASVSAVRLQASSPGVIARLERPMLRSFLRPSDPTASPLALHVEAPAAPRAEGTAPLQVSLRHALGRPAPVVVRVPLPPGATLAEPIDGVRQIQGALYVRTSLDSDPLPRVIAVPLRFALAGRVTLPEATARIDDDDLPPARAPARPLHIQPPR